MRLVLHIGPEKTGSTAIQLFLRRNEKALRDLGCLYTSQYRLGPVHREIYTEPNCDMVESLRREFSGYRSAILSYEGGYRADDDVLRHLTSLSDDTLVLIFFRPQLDFINSSYNQQFKAHRQSVGTIDDFDYRRDELFRKFDLNFHLLRWERYFSRSQIKVVPFDRTAPPHPHVLDCANIPSAARDRLEYLEENANKAADLSSLRIIYLVKSAIGDDDPDRLLAAMNIVHRRLQDRWIDTRYQLAPLLLSDEDVIGIARAYSDANKELFARYGLSESDLERSGQTYAPSVASELFQATAEEVETARSILAELG